MKSRLRNAYLIVVGLIGFSLMTWAFTLVPRYEQWGNLVLLIFLAVLAHSTITFTVRGAYLSVGSAISLASVPLFGPLAAVAIAGSAEIIPWILSLRKNPTDKKGALLRLGFNAGMSSIAAYGSGLTFVLVSNLLHSNTFLVQYVPWLPAAVVSDQINLWLLIGILYLANGVTPREAFHEHRWAIPINILLTGIGGGILATAVTGFGTSGIMIFFLPIFLSGFAFRLYVQRTKEQMDHLEELVDQRTQDLSEANQALEELHRQKDAFLAVLTHDMRTPLTSIHGFAALLFEHGDMGVEERRQMLTMILRNEAALLEIVNNILDIEKLQSGKDFELYKEPFDFNLLVHEVSDSIQAQAQEKNISLDRVIDTTPIIVTADMQKIRRVIVNLVSNAIKYTPDGGKVEIGVRRNGRYVALDVVDNGYGIPADELPYIFDRFRRVSKHKHAAVGTGLGLSITKSLVEAHGGEIKVQSEENVGSTFTMQLPLYDE